MKSILIISLLLSTYCFSQKTYSFDYLVRYEFTIHKDSIEKTVVRQYLTNSKKNNYVAVVTDLDSLNYQMDFKDENGLTFNVNFLKSDLNNAETINVNCRYVKQYLSNHKDLIKNHKYLNMNDTLLEKETLNRYKLIYTKDRKRKPAEVLFIIENNTDFHLPILYNPLNFQEWKSEKSIPNGIFKERLVYDHQKNIKVHEKLVGYHKIDKKIIIDLECDYTTDK